MEELQKRKNTRLHNVNYDKTGAVFITVCTNNRRCLLSEIVGTGVLDGPSVRLLSCGIVADKFINQLNDFYNDISVDSYVIMPNHIHFLFVIDPQGGGPSGTPVPTIQNSKVSRFISTFKRFCNKECGENIWQPRSYDHVIRNQDDFIEHKKYILHNPKNWALDELYS